MDFSSVGRALDSLQRRQPPLPEECLGAVNRVATAVAAGSGSSSSSSVLLVSSLRELLTTEYKTNADASGDGKIRWEPLAVALFVSTELLQQQQQEKDPSSGGGDNVVYMDGPRVPSTAATPVAAVSAGQSISIATTPPPLPPPSDGDRRSLCATLHAACLAHLEHAEPRVRTLVARAVGAYCACDDAGPQYANEMHGRLAASIHAHIAEGRREAESAGENNDNDSNKYSKDSTGALDDTTGWRALETDWLCLAAMVAAVRGRYLDLFRDDVFTATGTATTTLLADCEHSSVQHRNRHVRAAAMQTLEQWVKAAVDHSNNNSNSNDNNRDNSDSMELLTSQTSPLRKTVIAVLKAGLADNWSQVRMAASVLCRVWFTSLLLHSGSDLDAILQQSDLMAPLLPRMCLNRFYLAQGVKLYSHETWALLFAQQQQTTTANNSGNASSSSGVQAVATHLPAVVRYYVQMCDADNHVVREAACQAIAELAARLGGDERHHAALEAHMDVLLQALLMCFHDESWPVRDEACLACGILCKAYPDQCAPEFKTLWERWTEQLTDQIWSVREDAAVALGDALEAYGEPVQEKLRALVRKILPAARDQPAMTAAEYRAHVNDAEQHTGSQMYSCGSLAPKLRKGGAGRIGCTNCGIDRPKAPWEATDGCIYLIREYVVRGTGDDASSGKAPAVTDGELVPLLRELVDVCRVQHFPQSDDLRATLWRNVPAVAQALGRQRFKSQYLEIFLELLFRNLESRTASALSKHAAGQCAEELAHLVGVAIFRARLDDCQRETYDQVMRERQRMPKGPGAGDVFSPFGPPGLLDAIHNQQ